MGSLLKAEHEEKKYPYYDRGGWGTLNPKPLLKGILVRKSQLDHTPAFGSPLLGQATLRVGVLGFRV